MRYFLLNIYIYTICLLITMTKRAVGKRWKWLRQFTILLKKNLSHSWIYHSMMTQNSVCIKFIRFQRVVDLSDNNKAIVNYWEIAFSRVNGKVTVCRVLLIEILKFYQNRLLRSQNLTRVVTMVFSDGHVFSINLNRHDLKLVFLLITRTVHFSCKIPVVDFAWLSSFGFPFERSMAPNFGKMSDREKK